MDLFLMERISFSLAPGKSGRKVMAHGLTGNRTFRPFPGKADLPRQYASHPGYTCSATSWGCDPGA